ncbi:MAG: hypothetical protein ACR2OW_05315 [Methyloligellaceae bacterium]
MTSHSVTEEKFRISVLLDGHPTYIDIKADNFFDFVKKADRLPFSNNIVVYENYVGDELIFSLAGDAATKGPVGALQNERINSHE